MSIGYLGKLPIWWRNNIFLILIFKKFWKYKKFNMINILAYTVYLSICFYITLIVGWRFYKIGFVYLQNLLQEKSVCEATNRILLTGYYLVNLGYVAIQLNNWETIENYTDLIALVTKNVGSIFLTLCLLHYLNMFIIYLVRKKTIQTT